MRGKEFLMKDLYSFARNEDEHKAQYDTLRAAYIKVFKRLGIGERTFVTFASGGIFSPFSEEFQTISEAGEDVIYIDERKNIAVNKEVLTDENLKILGLVRQDLVEKKAIEVGNIFHLGTKFSEPLGLRYKDDAGESHPVVMGSYGIGPSRVMGVIAEILSDDKGLVWPKSVTPFAVHLISITNGNADVLAEADRMYDMLLEQGIEPLYDDRDARAGEKFSDSDLIGIPLRLIVSEKTIAAGGIEVVERATGTSRLIAESTIVDDLRKLV